MRCSVEVEAPAVYENDRKPIVLLVVVPVAIEFDSNTFVALSPKEPKEIEKERKLRSNF